jgi:hypothetical protein
MILYALYFSVAVIVITAIAHSLVSATIIKVRDAATNNPKQLRGVTAQEALAKVGQWETTKAKLWPLAGALVVLSFVCVFFLPGLLAILTK